MVKVVIAGGGTGGHLYPAIAVCQALKQDYEIESITFIGHPDKSEAQLVPSLGFTFLPLRCSGMPRRHKLQLIGWIFGLWLAIFKALRYLKRLKPDVVFTTGGYTTAPVIIAAKVLKIPYMVHEPDAHPGLVNRKLAPWAAQVTCAFEEAVAQLPNPRVSVTGNPLRASIGRLTKVQGREALPWPWDDQRTTLVVIGGSQGAQHINQAVIEALPQLIETMGLQVIHQVGGANVETCKALCPDFFRNHPAYKQLGFIDTMDAVLAVADLAVCRAGSMSLSEMIQAHVPMVLVPYPFAAADHQRKNALAFQAQGVAVMVEDQDLTAQRLVEVVGSLFKESGRLEEMRQRAQSIARPDATKTIVELIKTVSANR